MNRYPPLPNSGANTGRIALLLIVVGVLGYVGYRQFFGDHTYSRIPKEVQLKYVSSDFTSAVNVEESLPILANPYRYAREFGILVYDFNTSLLRHVARRMDLSDSLQQQVIAVYDKHHPYLQQMIFDDFVALTDSSSSLYASWYQSEYSNAVDIFREVASKYTCFVVNQVLASLLKTEAGMIYVSGANADTPCGVALREGLQPMIERMKKIAAVQDFNRSKGILQERMERAIAELATLEVRDRKGIGASKRSRLFGLDVSKTEMEMTAISIVKIGFKLDKQFGISLNERAGLVTVTLPEPEILSHEVYPRIDKLDIGWLREIDQTDFNKNIDLLRREFRRDVLESNAFATSRQRAAELMDAMLTPVVKSLSPRYQIKVRFSGSDQEPTPPQPLDNAKAAANTSVR